MAKQHFYSRVPAKASMFNKADGFDTFACSEGLDRAWIESNLSSVYNYKPAKEEGTLIRNGQLQPVYFHFVNKNGQWVQSCTAFLPLDFTGERSSHLVHSLIMNDDEKNNILHNEDNAVLNPKMFVKDLKGFDLTSFDCCADEKYKETDYFPAKALSTKEFAEKYDSAMVKRLIYAMISAGTAKGKNIFISLSQRLNNCSENILTFLNTIMQIFPYCIREKLSFATYTGDPGRYSNFKIKGIVENAMEIPSSKGVVLHFGPKICLGLQDDVVRKENFLVGFFYDMLFNDELRRAFLTYTDEAIKRMPELANMNMKTLDDLVFLFCECSGMYGDRKLITDDEKMQEYVNAFDKYRNALNDEYRTVALKCLIRYPEQHAPIPPKIFNKIIKIYTDEPENSKNTIMQSLLQLIHTDAMRPKLFAFFSSVYLNENNETKKLIAGDLCRVYYGGFLRPQIMEFFASVFDGECEEIQDMMFDKIMLTVRTDSVREQIFDFIKKDYHIFTIEQKKKLYITYFEMLSEGDELTSYAVNAIEPLIKTEDEEIIGYFLERYYSIIEKEQRCKEHPVLESIMASRCIFHKSVIASKAFTDWQKRQGIVDEIIRLEWLNPIEVAFDEIMAMWDYGTGIFDELIGQIFDKNAEYFREKTKKPNPLILMRVEEKFNAWSKNFYGRKYAEKFINETIRPTVCVSLKNIFLVENGIEKALEYEEYNDYIRSAEEYEIIQRYKDLLSHFLKEEFKDFFACAKENASSLKPMLAAIKRQYDGNSTGKYIALELAPFFMGTPLDLNDIYSNVCEKEEELMAEASPLNREKTALTVLLTIINDFAVSDDEADGFVTGEKSPVKSLLNTFNGKYKRDGEKWLTATTKEKFVNFKESVYNTIDECCKKSLGEFLGKMFKK